MAIVGTVANFFATVYKDEKQREHERQTRRELWQREDQRALDRDRIEAYREFATAVSELSLVQDAPTAFPALVPYLPSKEEAAVQLIRTYDHVYTFSSSEVQNAAHDLLNAVLSTEDTPGEGALADARHEFVRRVGEEIGVSLASSDPEPILRDLNRQLEESDDTYSVVQ